MTTEVQAPDDTPTRAEQLEARCRKAMAALPKARGWDSSKARADELAYIDAILDQWLAER